MIVTLHDKSKNRPHLGEVFFLILIYTFAAIGALFVSVFFANRFKLTNVSGSVDVLSNKFQQNYASSRVLGSSSTLNSELTNVTSLSDEGIDREISELNVKKQQLISYLCSIQALTSLAPKNVLKIMDVKKNNGSIDAINNMIFAIKTHLKDPESVERNIQKCVDTYQTSAISEDLIRSQATRLANTSKDVFVWPENSEWNILRDGIAKDKELIKQAALVAQIDPRLIVSCLVVEQLRLYYSQRELYKKFFEPLKILANANKFSLGVMSIKEETAVAIEKHLKDPLSPFYLGKEQENTLDYPEGVDSGNIDITRYNRLTAANHYFNYLYGALYLKQFILQWEKADVDISGRPEIIGTLFNLGFGVSKPNKNPMVGGSNINIGSTNYSFGRLASEFFYSGEMADLFPYLEAAK